MLAEIFMMRLEAATRASAEPSTLNNPRFVPFDLAAPPSELRQAAGAGAAELVKSSSDASGETFGSKH